MIADELKILSDDEGRGVAVLNTADLIRVSAKTKLGKTLSVDVERGYVGLDAATAVGIYTRCPPVFGVISGRANRISALDWSIKSVKTEEDKIAGRLRGMREIFSENPGRDFYSLGLRIKMLKGIRRQLIDVHPDLSNFDRALYRWGRRIKDVRNDTCEEIKDFFSHPSPGQTWPDFIKEYVADLMIHGRAAVYKKMIGTRVGSVYVLPGGTVFPVTGTYVGEGRGYVQLPLGLIWTGVTTPQLFFSDEISFAQYMPNSAMSNGATPLDALVNLVTENMLFDDLMAKQADGSIPPEKLLVFGVNNPALDPTELPGTDPVDISEQRRIEHKINNPKKRAGVATLTGYGQPMVLDLSRENTMDLQMQRQDQIKKYVGLVFNATNIELNETSSSGTSGRSTSESQERIENQRGVRPILRIIEESFTREIIPGRYGFGYFLEFSSPQSDSEQIDIAKKKIESGLFSVNEVRVNDYNAEPINREQYDMPQAAQPAQPVQMSLDAISKQLGVE